MALMDFRGAKGDRGAAGERGKTGDHGQHGDKGDTGAEGKRGPANRRGLIGYIFLVVFVVLAFARVEQIGNSANEKIEKQSLANCQEIEEIKSRQREEEWDTFNRLDETLALLKLEKTPSIVMRAKRDRDAELQHYKMEPCPRELVD